MMKEKIFSNGINGKYQATIFALKIGHGAFADGPFWRIVNGKKSLVWCAYYDEKKAETA